MADFWLKVDKTLRYHGCQMVRGARALRWNIRECRVDRPVFIVGCSRAGTTLVYKVFSESEELGSLQRETHDFWADLHSPAERNWDSHEIPASCASGEDRTVVARYFYIHTGRARFVDKNNQNGLCIPYLYRLFPNAHFIYVKRSPGDNINSLIEGWGKANEFATWTDCLPEKINVDGGQYTRWCFFLASQWRDYLNASVEQVSAYQYKVINTAILDAKKLIPPQQWSEVFYEELVNDAVASFREVFSHVDLNFDTRMKAYCDDVISTPFNAFSEIRLDKWKDGRNAERVRRVLEDVAETAHLMGYNS